MVLVKDVQIGGDYGKGSCEIRIFVFLLSAKPFSRTKDSYLFP